MTEDNEELDQALNVLGDVPVCSRCKQRLTQVLVGHYARWSPYTQRSLQFCVNCLWIKAHTPAKGERIK